MKCGTGRSTPNFFISLCLLLTACQQPDPGTHVITRPQVIMLVPALADPIPLTLPADTSYLEHVFDNYSLVNIHALDSSICVDLRYADTSNFLHAGFYDGLRKAYMTCELAIRVSNAQHFLKQVDSSLTLVILDAARPQHIQQVMWDSLDLTPEKKMKYLTPPDLTSLHSYGCAVDLTVARDGVPLDMGTDFDQFDSLSQPRFEDRFLKQGRLNNTAIYNRRLLRYAMQAAGLRTISTEWWHFSLCTKPQAIARYPLIR